MSNQDFTISKIRIFEQLYRLYAYTVRMMFARKIAIEVKCCYMCQKHV